MSINPTMYFPMVGTQPNSYTTNPTLRFRPNQPPVYTSHQPVPQEPDDIMDEEAADSSPITISISAPVTVSGHTNRVSIDPAEIATRVAQAIASALRETSMSSAGIPMIDENGRPRPIEVRVDTALKIEGDQNVVGPKAYQVPEDEDMPNQPTEQIESVQKGNTNEGEGEEVERGRKRHRAA